MGSLLKTTEEAHILSCFVPWEKICIKFDKKSIGQHFWRLSRNLSGRPVFETSDTGCSRDRTFCLTTHLKQASFFLVARATRLGEFSPTYGVNIFFVHFFSKKRKK
jgi:hypothetical protein